ncbi:MAG: DUF3794 domain-containing protein [Romboutsia sp.]|uniref:DUF3794 domain-containing protein n=1 Tax=Romboutsia sp. TaxID=1965302 RepID=UPI003F419B4B
MSNCDYTSKTIHPFYDSCCEQDENVNIVGLYPENKIEKVLNCFPTNSWTQFFIPEVVDIPTKKPDVEGIISVHSSIKIISQRVVKTPVVTNKGIPDYTIANSECTKLTGRKLIIEGILNQKIVYTAAVDEQSVHSAHFSIPFSVFIIVSQDTPLSQKFKIDSIIEDIFTCRLSPRSVFKNTTIFIKATPVC